MARMYSKKKGKSRSKRPFKRVKPSWVSHDAKVVEQLVTKVAKNNPTSAKIGLVLRDSYGIPDVKAATGKRIHTILTEHKLAHRLPEDLAALIRRDINIVKHLEGHKKDGPSVRGLHLTESKINRLAKYYKRVGKLPVDWTFDRAKAKLLLE
jgi:small subunit ribosomal protein S15